jgi:hypothetical protein
MFAALVRRGSPVKDRWSSAPHFDLRAEVRALAPPGEGICWYPHHNKAQRHLPEQGDADQIHQGTIT